MTSARHRNRNLLLCAATATLAGGPLLTYAQAPASFDIGASVEVREGDEWSKAEVVKKEGRKYLIRYTGEGATEEWVTVDRLRKTGATTPDAKTDKTDSKTTDSKTDPKADDKSTKPAVKKAGFKQGDTIEVRDSGTWRKSRVINVRGEWLLIEYDNWNGWREWVEPWRTRKVGATEDDLPFMVSGNGRWKTGDNPPRPTPGPAPKKEDRAGGGADPFAAPAIEQESIQPDRSANQDMLPSSPGAWAVAPDAYAGQPNKPAPMRAKADDKDLRLNKVVPQKSVVMVVYTDFMARQKMVVEKLDLAAGLSTTLQLPQASMPMSLSPNGKVIAARSNGFHGGTRSRIDLYAFESAGDYAKHLVSFNPYGGKGKPEDVEWLAMPDDTTLLTCAGDGDLVAWEVGAGKAKALWTVPLGKNTVKWHNDAGNNGLILSPNNKYVLSPCSDGVVVLEAKTGKTLGIISEGPTSSATSLSISPSGKTLVGIVGGLLVSWDLETGKFVREVGTVESFNSVICPDDGVALTNTGKLIDLKTGAVAWQYDVERGSEGGFNLVGKQVAYPLENRLCVATLPQPSAKTALGKITEDVLLLKPGVKVAMDIGINAEGDQKAKIEKAITKQLKDAGIEVDPSAPIKLVARTEDGKTEQREYRKMGGPGFPRTETVNVTEKITRIYLEVAGKHLWERESRNSAGFSVSIKEGQTMQDAVSATNTYNVGFLQTVRIPTILPNPQEADSIGKSQLLAAGAKDVR